eukprot:TRINITY_DN68243_c0_g1_i1.p1 TRINITY_DN68243_c0_g1~~TRINITY_DN68243_c0_g1_i1.p1  ORF type:complete len:376 (-),score=29.76 TRINITY_DN68243_c0_g1_i1:347-1474(-)
MTVVGVVGAGAIGCYVGGRLAAAGIDVILLGRQRIVDEIQSQGGLSLKLAGNQILVPSSKFRVTTNPADLSACTVLLVTVKVQGTQGIAQDLLQHTKSTVPIVCLQNGLTSSKTLADLVAPREVRSAVVGYNVVWKSPAQFGQTTDGVINIEFTTNSEIVACVQALSKPPMQCELSKNIVAVQHTKLLINLLNSVNALSGIPLPDTLRNDYYRHIWANCIQESIAIFKLEGRPMAPRKVPATWLPTLLRLPWPLLRHVMKTLAKLDPDVKLSMLQDLEAKRYTEIDHLNGAVVELARKHGNPEKLVPTVFGLQQLVKECESKQEGSPKIKGTVLANQLGVTVKQTPASLFAGAVLVGIPLCLVVSLGCLVVRLAF